MTSRLSIPFALTLLSVVAVASGCGKENEETKDVAANTAKLGGAEYLVLDGASLAKEESELRLGKVVFVSPLAGNRSAQSYTLRLKLADGGSLKLVSNSDKELGGGVGVAFNRSGRELRALITSPGGDQDVSAAFSGVDASGELNLVIDVHNSESPAHILVWDGSDFAEDAARLNTEAEGFQAKGQGSDKFWGLELSNATVTRALVGEQKFKE